MMADTETSTTTDPQTHVLVLKDEAGDYFLVPQELLAQGRVPAERKAEVERLIAEGAQGGNGEDVQGFSFRSEQDARMVASVHLLTAQALYALGDTSGGEYFRALGQGAYQPNRI